MSGLWLISTVVRKREGSFSRVISEKVVDAERSMPKRWLLLFDHLTVVATWLFFASALSSNRLRNPFWLY